MQPNGQVDRLGGHQTGFLVPGVLRDRWTLILGDSKVELPRLLDKLVSVDFFHHDSLHTFDHMMFEFQTLWPKLRKGGVLSSDDVNDNDAFAKFCEMHSLRPVLRKLPHGWGGYAVK